MSGLKSSPPSRLMSLTWYQWEWWPSDAQVLSSFFNLNNGLNCQDTAVWRTGLDPNVTCIKLEFNSNRFIGSQVTQSKQLNLNQSRNECTNKPERD